MLFTVNDSYTRKQIRALLGLSENIGGAWSTGYVYHNNEWFVFANIGVPGTTGHDYGNFWLDGKLHWFAKNHTRIDQPQIQQLTSGTSNVYIFTREATSDPFIFRGTGHVVQIENTTPVKVIWSLESNSNTVIYGDEAVIDQSFVEGNKIQLTVNIYERDRDARNACLDYYGLSCIICKFNFEKKYGEIGKGFIHVHHLKPLSEIGVDYKVDPIKDLRPVCPNCHSMIHLNKKARSIEDIQAKIVEMEIDFK